MLIVAFAIGAILITVTIIGTRLGWLEDTGFVLKMLGLMTLVVTLGWGGCLITHIATEITIDEKIEIYEEENADIEKYINEIVDEYKDFEMETHSEWKDKDAMTAITFIPELKSDTLVQKQMEVYVQNKENIKSLKTQKIDLKSEKWMLYFGN